MRSEDAMLRFAWSDFCDGLKQAGEIAFDPALPQHQLDQSSGLRQVARNIALALQFELENCDPLHPQLMHYFDAVRKQGGDNPDALYLGAPINGLDHYRISGSRGTANYLAVTAVESGGTPFGGSPASMLQGDNLEVASDGTFEINIGPEPCGPNWLKTSPETYRVTIRQFFGDWERERPMRAAIERIGTMAPRSVPGADDLAHGLARSSEWLATSVRYWAEMLARWKQEPGIFRAYSELGTSKIDATPGGEPVTAYWTLPRDEALVVRVIPPEARYWSVELGNAWWESMDYRDRLSSTNCHYAHLEQDGELIIVIAHEDPGVPNWLDASGYAEGYITFRWIGVQTSPRPTMERTRLDELASALGPCTRVDEQERVAQIKARQRGLLNRVS
ncbi:hypothetical protein MB02_12505 [Croceicoccus estronivorus]|uniref:DUF1214 domain-containing protein n=1 Tax=Croceicoccus estronivorus TaxID=1172626 RepID=UPI00082C4157|nr:DUF1214 domain-containing protein [Croceicoccus estronivorus]OCC23429.1 hypothetical protein MB02_12505 [Croceicoccus estronivorus]